MNRQSIVLLGLVMLAGGCAGFKDQTSELQPHGLVCFAQPSGLSGEPRVVALDGLRVSPGRYYRVKPGEHQVTLRLATTGVNTYRPVGLGTGGASEQQGTLHKSDTGQASVSGVNPSAGQQMLKVEVESRDLRFLTNRLSVEAGWRYEVDLNNVEKSRFQ